MKQNEKIVILCYGDSNTWGFKPVKECLENWNMRFDENTRWTGRLQNMLGSGYNDTGDGIYIETNYPHDISLEIYGGVIAAVDDEHGALALRVFEEDAENVSVKIYGGDFNTEVNPAYYAELPVEETPEEDNDKTDVPATDKKESGMDTGVVIAIVAVAAVVVAAVAVTVIVISKKKKNKK